MPAPSPGRPAIDSHQLECEVGLDRGAHVGRAAGIDRPAPVGELMILDVARTSGCRPGRIPDPGTPAAGCIPTRGSCRLRARRPSSPRRAAAPSSQSLVRSSADSRASCGRVGTAHRATSGRPFRRLREDASVLVGDHAFATLSLDPRCLEDGKTIEKRTTSDGECLRLTRKRCSSYVRHADSIKIKLQPGTWVGFAMISRARCP